MNMPQVVADFRPAWNEGRGAWVASIVDGPRDLLQRGSEAEALRDGAAHAAAYWRREGGTWKAGLYEPDGTSLRSVVLGDYLGPLHYLGACTCGRQHMSASARVVIVTHPNGGTERLCERCGEARVKRTVWP